MKKVIRKTGEIIDVIAYSGDVERSDHDSISYVNKFGEEIQEKLNYYWDLADLEKTDEGKGYWEDFRNKAALAIFCSKLLNPNNKKNDVCESTALSIHYADYLIKKLIESAKSKEIFEKKE